MNNRICFRWIPYCVCSESLSLSPDVSERRVDSFSTSVPYIYSYQYPRKRAASPSRFAAVAVCSVRNPARDGGPSGVIQS